MKRGYIKTEAIVLRSTDYSESDRILTLFTRTNGKLSAIAKGAKKSKRRFVGRLDVVTCVEAMLFKSRSMELARLDEARLIDGYTELKGDMERLGYASYMVELADEFTPPGEPNEAMFEHLKGFLHMLRGAVSTESAARFFEVRLLDIAGLMPHLTGCVSCRKDTVEERMCFVMVRGGLLCRGCMGQGIEGIGLSAGTIKTLVMAARLPAGKLHVLSAGEVFKKEARKMLSECIKYHLGKVPRCMRFIDMVNAI